MDQKPEVAHPRKRGTGGEVTMSARCAKALIGAVPRRRFAYFAAAGKVGRPTGRNPPPKNKKKSPGIPGLFS